MVITNREYRSFNCFNDKKPEEAELKTSEAEARAFAADAEGEAAEEEAAAVTKAEAAEEDAAAREAEKDDNNDQKLETNAKKSEERVSIEEGPLEAAPDKNKSCLGLSRLNLAREKLPRARMDMGRDST